MGSIDPWGLFNKPCIFVCNFYLYKKYVPHYHYSDIIMGSMASQTTSLKIVYLSVYSGQRKHLSPAPLAFAHGIHRWPVNSQHKGLITRKMFPFDDVIMFHALKSDHII